MKRHLGIYPYYCPYCKKGLSGTKDTKKHLKSNHTGLWGYHCVKCVKELETIHLLKDHLKECDPEEEIHQNAEQEGPTNIYRPSEEEQLCINQSYREQSSNDIKIIESFSLPNGNL